MIKDNKNSKDFMIKSLKYLKMVLHELSKMFEEYYPLNNDFDYEVKNHDYNDYEKRLRK